MVKHNNTIVNVHLRKHWMTRVKNWFKEPAKRERRQDARERKAERIFPRPLQTLRPVVRGCTLKYKNLRRYGRGFTFEEIRRAGLTPQFARSIGISVDHRRTNTNQEQLDENVARIEAYKNKIILFPRKENEYKKGILADSTKEQIESADAESQNFDALLPITQDKKKQKREVITDEMKNTEVRTKQTIYWKRRRIL